MGVIIKQSFWGTFISYAGVIIGYVNTLYLRPKFFELEQIGLFTLITANAMMISPISSLGMGSSFLKFFPSFEEKNRNQLFTFLFILTVFGNTIIILFGYFLRGWIAQRYIETAPSYIDYLFITGSVIVSNSLFELAFNYSKAKMNVIFPSFLREVFLRLGTILLVCLYAIKWISFDSAVIGLGCTYMLSFAILFSHLFSSMGLRFDFHFQTVSKGWVKNLFQFASYSMLMAGSFAILNNISYDQTTSFLGAKANGVFSTCFFIGVIVEMPRRNMSKIISPIVSDAFQKKDFSLITDIYKRTSITMTVIGSLLLIGIVTNLDDLFSYIPQGDNFKTGYWIVVGVCFAKLFTMISSFPGLVITFSDSYRYNLFFQSIAAFELFTLNNILIPKWGLNAIAINYFLIIALHQVLMVIFVYRRFKIHPFSKYPHLKLFLISITVGLAAYFFHLGLNPIIEIIIRSLLTTIIFVFLIYKIKISQDINNLIDSVLLQTRTTIFKK